MSVISKFPLPPPEPGLIGKILKGIGKVAKYAWSVITGTDETQDKIANQKGVNPQKDNANELAELNKLLVEYRQKIISSGDELEREMIVECSMMLQDIMNLFEEQNKELKIIRADSVKRKFNRACRELKGTFSDYIRKKISLDDAECIKILKLPAGELKNQRLQEMKQNVFIEAGNEIINRIRDTVEDFSETVGDAFEEHLARAEETVQTKANAFEELSQVSEDDGNSVGAVLLQADYLLAVSAYADTLMEM